MKRTREVGIRLRIFLVLVPLLIGSFTVAGYVAVHESRNQLMNLSGDIIRYKLELLERYSNNQWRSLQSSGFAGNKLYRDVVRRSVERFANDMITRDSELIFSIAPDGQLEFATRDIGSLAVASGPVLVVPGGSVAGLTEFSVSGTDYYGLSVQNDYTRSRLYMVQNTDSFSRNIRSMTIFQSLTFGVSLAVIIAILVVFLNYVINPIRRIAQGARRIAENKDLSWHIRVEYSDEVGRLAHEFNNMTTSLDLAIRKLKKKALDEAVARKHVLLREIEALEVLGKAANFRDLETGAHIARVSRYCQLLSRMLGQDEEMQHLILLASPLHDIGKLGIPDSILLKPGPLNPEEMETIRTHANIGYEIMKNPTSRYLKAGAVIALSHHEMFDGTGYPQGLKGDDIPIIGRITAIADVFDAVTTNRPYKEAWKFEDAVEHIRAGRGTHFDPKLVDLFLEHRDDVHRIFMDTEWIHTDSESISELQ